MFQKQLSVSNSRWLLGWECCSPEPCLRGLSHSVCVDMGAIGSNTTGAATSEITPVIPVPPIMETWHLVTRQKIVFKAAQRKPGAPDRWDRIGCSKYDGKIKCCVTVMLKSIQVVYSVQFLPVFNVIPLTFHRALRPWKVPKLRRKCCCFNSSKRKGGKKRYDAAQVRAPSLVHACWCEFNWNFPRSPTTETFPCGKIKHHRWVAVKAGRGARPQGRPQLSEHLAFFFFFFIFSKGSTGGFLAWKELECQTWEKSKKNKKTPPTLPSHQWGISPTLIHVLLTSSPLPPLSR